MKNELHFGDNLDVMRDIPSQSYHLCYLDPPLIADGTTIFFLAILKHKEKRSMTRGIGTIPLSETEMLYPIMMGGIQN